MIGIKMNKSRSQGIYKMATRPTLQQINSTQIY